MLDFLIKLLFGTKFIITQNVDDIFYNEDLSNRKILEKYISLKLTDQEQINSISSNINIFKILYLANKFKKNCSINGKTNEISFTHFGSIFNVIPFISLALYIISILTITYMAISKVAHLFHGSLLLINKEKDLISFIFTITFALSVIFTCSFLIMLMFRSIITHNNSETFHQTLQAASEQEIVLACHIYEKYTNNHSNELLYYLPIPWVKYQINISKHLRCFIPHRVKNKKINSMK
ncbi:hypothetical protein ACGP04_11605 [Piscirickettsia salmonis]|uniref:hypothetical protein n=1 Tax=Piscirickettsia salmonis TaxID=1238 RepID=UPI003752F068